MTRRTERQILSDELFKAIFIQLLVETDEELLQLEDLLEDEEDGEEEEEELDDPLSHVLLEALAELYSNRYTIERRSILKTSDNLDLLLHTYKVERPEIFRSFVRMSPEAFDALVSAIEDDEVFTRGDQTPVTHQLAVALYWLGHYGNAASTVKVALWAGIGYGTVRLFMKRVMEAVCRENFRKTVMAWPSDDTKEHAMDWIEENSCEAWRPGWLMVDGTLVPLYSRPAFFNNTWYDRKSNYSMNLQLVTTPDLRIIDFAVGLPGSQHDATAWKDTYIYQNHHTLLKDGEWVWADSAYPLRKWCQAPYKSCVVMN
ncbi:hypothetical protein K435DRAFT_655724 [Dendrothele bispora CBS 962.96]|uniref:DDE Tnp4 domain-containing protein n=1 Tax=Dendrothele bispora (strain CBS 962.96) TaxID=1314807 RepID=A0A4S8MFA2_DENBC|nr:hypothetical protein K435DRAFT_655724 [Dendrothele bispora CBS 962.96]